MGQDDPTRARRGRPPNHAGAPHGPDEVVPAVVAAAIDQFAENGIAGVTVRQIAAQAAVNPGLVHRYIGSKLELVRAAMAAAGADLDRLLDANDEDRAAAGSDRLLDRPSVQQAMARYERLLAHLALEDHDLEGVDVTSTLWLMAVDRARRGAGLDARAARLRAVSIVALDLGWRLFEPVVAAATRLEPGEEADVWRALPSTAADLANRP